MPRSDQLRVGRFSEPERIYLLTSTVHERQPIFADVALGRLLVAELRSAQNDALVESLAWVVMPDHLHWLLVLKRGSVSELMRRVKGRSARRINSTLKCRGRVWQDGYHDRAVRREEDVLPLARYIVANPLRAGLVARVGDYPLWDAVWL
jgi:REP element-mobilizing transposase RayT